MQSRGAARAVAPVSFGAPAPPPAAPVAAGEVDRAIGLARDGLIRRQHPDGHWCGELEGDTILESEFVLLQAFLGRLGDPRLGRCARTLLAEQLPEGGWGNYPGGPPDVSASAKAYFALKLAGYRPEEEPLRRARMAILDLGGAECCNSFTRFSFAALGQIPYSHCPSVPPELMRLPAWFPLSPWRMSSWTRAMLAPLSIVQLHQPVTALPPSLGIAELFRTPPHLAMPPAARFSSPPLRWANAFRLADRFLKVYDAWMPRRWRRRGEQAAARWMLDRFEGSDGLAAIFPPMVYSIMALHCLGYGEESPERQWAERQLDGLLLEDNDALRIQPCLSPVWDTAIAALALGEAGLADDHPSLLGAADWLLEREIRQPGDWSVRFPQVEPGGWAFEYQNRFYPDLDDTAMVLLALRRTARGSDDVGRGAVERGMAFLKAMQSSDHGWAAFDKDCANPLLEQVPFADHNAMLDPSCPDITGRVLELFGKAGWGRGRPQVDKAIQFLFDRQEPEGCWFGRWGVNYIYGTWQALTGLAAVGYDMRHPRVAKAAEWLKSVQQDSGGWGESCASYDHREQMGRGAATPSQTAWAIMGLAAAGEASSDAVRRGVRWLVDQQQRDGSWDEDPFTGTGFPRVFYLKYHYYRLYFPLLALARVRAAWQAERPPAPRTFAVFVPDDEGDSAG